MEPASALAIVLSVVALCAAAFNSWVYRLRRSQTTHLWLALSAVGIAGMACFMALLYQAEDPERARSWQLLMLASSAPLYVGFTRFTTGLLSVSRPGLERRGNALAIAVLVLSAWPDAFFSGDNVRRHVGISGSEYFSGEVTLAAMLFLAVVAVVFLELVTLFVRHAGRLGDESRFLIVMVTLWFGCGLNDIAVAVRLFDGPMLTVVGWAGVLMGFTTILSRRMTGSMEALEQSAEHLQALVEERTEALREREMQIAHGEEMATIGTLAAGVAHEINTPIAYVSSSFNRLAELKDDPIALSEAREILGECREGVDRIRAIVADLLDLAQYGGSEPEHVDLRQVVDATLPLLEREARGRAELVPNHGSIPPVLGDPHQLGQVVLNLVANALQAIPEGEPDRNRVEVTTREHLGVVQLIVEDTGPGIPDEIRDLIFDPFFTTRESTGTGLGLAVSHELITRHHGRITLESNGRGTTATVSLPPIPESERAALGLVDPRTP